jgi:hypothetical protein
MKKLTNKFVFYFVIMEENQNDHLALHKLIHSLVPQAIIESISNFEEAGRYFRESAIKPHLLFISEEMLKAGLSIATEGNFGDEVLESMPFVLLSNKKSSEPSEHPNYSKPYNASNFVSIVGNMNHKWVA